MVWEISSLISSSCWPKRGLGLGQGRVSTAGDLPAIARDLRRQIERIYIMKGQWEAFVYRKDILLEYPQRRGEGRLLQNISTNESDMPHH
jgi:hypothetical protein